MDSILQAFFDDTGISSVQTIIPILLMGLAIPYAILRIRDGSAEDQDPTIGLKCALFFPFSVGILLFLLGATHLAKDLIVFPPDDPMARLSELTQTNRDAYGLMMGGFVVAFIHMLFILAMTNNSRWPDTRRVYVGVRFVVHMIVLVAVLITLSSRFFVAEPNINDMKPYFGVLAVWGPSWLLHLILLRSYRGAGSKTPKSNNESAD